MTAAGFWSSEALSFSGRLEEGRMAELGCFFLLLLHGQIRLTSPAIYPESRLCITFLMSSMMAWLVKRTREENTMQDIGKNRP
jgi:hypothetical protein